ncbi:MAG: flavin reductase family protein [Eggerthellaceae bacterium]
MIDKSAFRDLSYGLYIVSSMKDGRAVGCVVNTFAQVTSDPPQVSIAINKDNYTTQGILETGKFEVSVVCKEASMELIGMFGFHTSEDTDKFLDFEDRESSQGIPYVAEQICAHFSVKVKEQLDLGTHIFFLGDVVAAERSSISNR